MISAVIGAGFALLISRYRLKQRGVVLAGTAYGALWWMLGPLTLMPLMIGMPLGWNAVAALEMIPSLLGHVLYGAVLGWGYARLTLGANLPDPQLLRH